MNYDKMPIDSRRHAFELVLHRCREYRESLGNPAMEFLKIVYLDRDTALGRPHPKLGFAWKMAA